MKRNVYGYMRAFRQDPRAALQEEAMKNAGITYNKIYVDKPGEKNIFCELLSKLLPGDLVVVKSLSQLGYNYNEIYDAWHTITQELRSHIRVLDMTLVDTRMDEKKFHAPLVMEIVSQILSYATERERFYIKLRQAEGIASAREQGKHLGRPRISKPAKFDEIYDKWRAKLISAGDAMKQLGLKRSTFERFVKEKKEETAKKMAS